MLGARRSISRARASAARRTSVNVQRGSMRTLTCMPREPLVFGQPRRPELLEQRLHLQRDAAHVVPRDAGTGIEIDAQLVGVLEVVRAHGMRVKLDAAEVHDPREPRGVVDDDLFRRAPRGERERRRAEPVRARLGRALLVEGLALGAVDEALEHDGPVADAAQRAGRDRQVVPHDVELGELRLAREVGLARVGDPDLAPLDGENLGFFLRHAPGPPGRDVASALAARG